jgi:Ca2+-binding RTX toxin-like protein
VVVGADQVSCGFTDQKSPPPTCGGAGATLVGTEGDDVLPGGVVSALGGNDLVRGRASGDRLCGDDGNDRLSGGGGNDVLIGGAGDDTFNGGAGFDVCVGGAGTDAATGCEVTSGIP